MIRSAFQQNVFSLDLTEQESTTPSGGVGVTLARDLGENLELRLAGAASVDLGPAADFNDHTFVFTANWTRVNATDYSVVASIDSLDDMAPAFEITGTITPPSTLADASAVYAFFNSLPGGADADLGSWDAVQIDRFKFDVIDVFDDVIPVAPALALATNTPTAPDPAFALLSTGLVAASQDISDPVEQPLSPAVDASLLLLLDDGAETPPDEEDLDPAAYDEALSEEDSDALALTLGGL